jgi:hypothetical protein
LLIGSAPATGDVMTRATRSARPSAIIRLGSDGNPRVVADRWPADTGKLISW